MRPARKPVNLQTKNQFVYRRESCWPVLCFQKILFNWNRFKHQPLVERTKTEWTNWQTVQFGNCSKRKANSLRMFALEPQKFWVRTGNTELLCLGFDFSIQKAPNPLIKFQTKRNSKTAFEVHRVVLVWCRFDVGFVWSVVRVVPEPEKNFKGVAEKHRKAAVKNLFSGSAECQKAVKGRLFGETVGRRN